MLDVPSFEAQPHSLPPRRPARCSFLAELVVVTEEGSGIGMPQLKSRLLDLIEENIHILGDSVDFFGYM